MATKAKEFRFPVAVEWRDGRTVCARVAGKDTVAVTSPPEFNREADPSVWSPEDLFGAAAAACLAVTITGLAQREELPLLRLAVSAVGVVGRRVDGAFGFTKLEQRVELDTRSGEEERAHALVEKAKQTCLVTVSLDLDVETEILVSGT